MKINTHLLNLVTQILQVEEKKRAAHISDNQVVWDKQSKEVVRLKTAAVEDMIATAPFKSTYNEETALLKLNQTLEMFKIYGKEDHV